MQHNSSINEYIRVMHSINVDDAVKQQIITHCARHSTLHKIKLGKFKITAVKKDKTADKI